MEDTQDSLSTRMCQEHSARITVKTSGSSSKKSAKSRTEKFLFLDLKSYGQKQERLWEMTTPLRGGHLTHSIGVAPKDALVSTLSQILMDKVPEKYYLSAKACQGILRRAAIRGKDLPEVLKTALERQALTA